MNFGLILERRLEQINSFLSCEFKDTKVWVLDSQYLIHESLQNYNPLKSKVENMKIKRL